MVIFYLKMALFLDINAVIGVLLSSLFFITLRYGCEAAL